MNVAADAASTGPPWLVISLAVLTLLGVFAMAMGPVLVEKVKGRFGKPKETPAQLEATGEAILQKWLAETKREKAMALRKVERLEVRIDALEKELYRRGWDGRLP